MKHTHFKIGDNCVISDISGFKFNASEMVYGVDEQAGLVMHKSEFSPHNPQFNIQPVQEHRDVAIVRTEPSYVFVLNNSAEDL